MGERSIGQVTQIVRYPVKSMAGEELLRSRIAHYGLFGDRCFAFIDETKEGWEAYVTAREIPQLLGYRAKLVDAASGDERVQLQVTSPDGRPFRWDDALLSDIQTFAGSKMSMLRHPLESGEMTAVDAGSILIVSDRTFRRLEQLTGKPIDRRRFRANLVIALTDDSFGDEQALIGRTVAIGSSRIRIGEGCERCAMITIDPVTHERDATILRTVQKEMNLIFGVYASVTLPGWLAVGDPVLLE